MSLSFKLYTLCIRKILCTTDNIFTWRSWWDRLGLSTQLKYGGGYVVTDTALVKCQTVQHESKGTE